MGLGFKKDLPEFGILVSKGFNWVSTVINQLGFTVLFIGLILISVWIYKKDWWPCD